MSRISRLKPILLAGALVVAGCGSSSPAPTGEAGCDQWCGNGRATVSFRGTSASVAGGGCVDQGADGIDARFGDWQGVNGVSDYLVLTIFQAGASLAPATDSPSGQPIYPPVVSGSVAGQPFVLGSDAVVRYSPDGTGSFSGTDVNGGGPASGTYSCR